MHLVFENASQEVMNGILSNAKLLSMCHISFSTSSLNAGNE